MHEQQPTDTKQSTKSNSSMVLKLAKNAKKPKGKEKAGSGASSHGSNNSRKPKGPTLDQDAYIGTGLKRSNVAAEEYVISRPSTTRKAK